MHRNRIILLSLVAVILSSVGIAFLRLPNIRGPEITVKPLGRVKGNYGDEQFMVAVTNNTTFTREIVIGRTQVFPFGDKSTTNFMGPVLYRLAPKSGLVVPVAPPTNSGAWFLGISQKRGIGSAELKGRVLAVRVKALAETNVFPVWGPIERIEVEK